MPEPRKIPIVDFRRGARTNPAFQRGSQLAGLDMLNLEVDGQGRPVPRLGYVIDNELEVEGFGKQLVRIHDLGGSGRQPISRTYRFRTNESYIYHHGRIFISEQNSDNDWIDIQTGERYPWKDYELNLPPTYNQNISPEPPISSIQVIQHLFTFVYTFESIRFGFETGFSAAASFEFPIWDRSGYDHTLQYDVYMPSQPIPNWVDRINFYMQTETDNATARLGEQNYKPYPSERRYIKFGAVRFFTDAQRQAYSDNPYIQPITMRNPHFEYHEGDPTNLPEDGIEYSLAIPTLIGFLNQDVVERVVGDTITESPTDLYPIMLYAERIWGWNEQKQLLQFSELGRYDFFPPDYALDLDLSGQSRVTAMHPAPTVSAFFVFKQDAIHVVRGQGIVTGLRQQELASTDLDSSGVILQHGTLSPRTIVSGENGIYFISRDKKLKYLTIDSYGNTDVDDVGIAIDDFLKVLTIEEQKNLVAFLFNNCYHLIMPNDVLILDLQKRYWTRSSWRLTDAFWSEGGINSESTLYALRSHDSFGRFQNDIVRLYESDKDGEADIPCEWESQDITLPYETTITGLYVYYTGEPTELNFDLYIDNELIGNFTGIPERSNHYRIGCFGYGHEVRIRLKSADGIPRINAMFLEIP